MSIANETLADKIESIKNSFSGFSSSGLKKTMAMKQNLLDDYDPTDQCFRDLQTGLEDDAAVLSLAESYEAVLKIAESLFIADQIRQDVDHQKQALENLYYFDDSETYCPEELRTEITGDAIITETEINGAKYILDCVVDGQAKYTLQKS